MRWLIEIDMGKARSGGSVSPVRYEDVVVDTQSELRRLRESMLAISVARLPDAAAELLQLRAPAQPM